MGTKLKAKGSYKDYMKLTTDEISALSDRQLRAIVNKLNDTANKRYEYLKRTGFATLSPAMRGRAKSGKGTFKTGKAKTKADLKAAYLAARQFLAPESTSTMEGLTKYNQKFEKTYSKVLGKEYNDPSNYDRRYKKEKVLKKSVRDKLGEFWNEYDKWKEIQRKNNPDSAKGDTNINDVEYFEQYIYGMDEEEMDEYAEEEYEEAEDLYDDYDLEEEEYEDEEPDIQPSKPKRRGTKTSKQDKLPKKRGKAKPTITSVFEKIKIF